MMEQVYTMVYEVVDNSIDESLGLFKNIEVIINKDGTITVNDDGRGIPVDIHKGEKNQVCRSNHDPTSRRWKI